MKPSTNGYGIIETTEELRSYSIIGSKAGDNTRFAFKSQDSADRWMNAEIIDGNAKDESWFSFADINADTELAGLVVTNE
jgi:hypothetical protein